MTNVWQHHMAAMILENDTSKTREIEDSSDAELLRQFRAGNKEALRLILRRYESSVIGYLTNYTKDPDHARDLTQETFLRLIKYPPKAVKGDSLRPWIFSVARNLAHDSWRKRKHTVELEQAPEACSENPGTRLHRLDAKHLLATLSDDLRDVVTLRIYGELKFNEIAEQLNIPLGTALWRMRHAMEKLKHQLENRD
ncbi:MAG: sigma-70 family RNA polymerase sigma factor [Verrucomicrobiota bacterium]